jgi:hypothetical protein
MLLVLFTLGFMILTVIVLSAPTTWSRTSVAVPSQRPIGSTRHGESDAYPRSKRLTTAVMIVIAGLWWLLLASGTLVVLGIGLLNLFRS